MNHQHPTRPAPRPAAILAASLTVALLSLAAGCSQDEASAAGGLASGAAARRVEDEPVQTLRAYLDLGRADAARPLLRELAPVLGAEAPLLQARLASLDGEPIEATRLVEEARAQAAGDPRVYATAAELHAAAGRLETARDEIARGLEECGEGRATPELLRAQGVVFLCMQGGAGRGVELIETALKRDPGLPFVQRPLGQGYLLMTKESLAGGRAMEAVGRIRRSLRYDPSDLDARRLLSDSLAAAGDLAGAAIEMQKLVDEGRPFEGELGMLYKRAGMALLVQSKREQAIESFRRARTLGLSDEELSTGAMILGEAANQAIDVGMTAYAGAEYDRARDAFREALKLDPDSLAAHNHLGVVLFKQHEFKGAAFHWGYVLDTAIDERLDLPEPVHLNLAKALFRAERSDEARAVLEAYLERDPEGLWVPDTNIMLEHLDG